MYKVLAICPTRSRPKMFKEMLESFLNTRSVTDMIVCLDDDDPCLPEYLAIIPSGIAIQIGVRNTPNKWINQIATFNDAEYYFAVNDDFLFITEGWDDKLIDAAGDCGISFPNDLIHHGQESALPLIPKKLYDITGYIMLPTVRHLCGEIIWKVLGQGIGHWKYVPDAVIEHRHFSTGKMAPDEISNWTNDQEQHKKDKDMYSIWLSMEAPRLIEEMKCVSAR